YTYIEGNSMDIVERPEAAYQAGALLGRFHVALADLDYEFINPRDPVHHLDRHIQHLQASLEHQQHHVNYAQVEALAMDILQQAELLPRLPEMNIRKVHGDPKINNFLFNSQTGDAICMVDFDTLSTMPVALELGDAMRSWCNPGGENIQAGHFAMDLF
ncbi:MAG: phosphotransferase, partial [Gammaproteobacteria bacterium]|nr:phosphotransferase [Gammaproteobacteria bacterium]NIO61487.1 phosphotransferase [Gammaproteobacteria bacterium]